MHDARESTLARAAGKVRLLFLLAAIGACLLVLGPAAAAGQRSPERLGSAGPSPVQVVAARPSHTGLIVSPDGVMAIARGTSVVPHRVLVRFRAGTPAATRIAARADVEATGSTAYHLVPRLELLHLPRGQSVVSAIAALSRDPRVEYAVPDVIVRTAATANDPLYSSQWALQAIGAPAAWDRTAGSTNVTVAVLDSGVDLHHPDLAANLVPGWNFVDNTSDPSDDLGHGTHVAGIIGAIGGNGVGVAGAGSHVSIMPLKICDAGGSCSLDDEVSALQYAVDHGAKIANASFGGNYGGYQPEEDAIAAAGRKGLLYVAAAGNAGYDNDLMPFYPASYPLDNIISVAATTSSQGLASFSDYGFTSVLVAAPGQDILSTMLTSGPLSNPSGYGALSGTSMAAPQVTGAAALLWAEHPDWTMQQVRMRLLTTASPLASLAGKVATCGQINVAAATDPTRPDWGIVCLRLRGTGEGTVRSDPAAIDCGATCAASVPLGTTVTLTATPGSGSIFVGWGGACSGSDACTVAATGIGDVTATFRASGSPAGWRQQPLSAPAGRDPFVPGSALQRGPGDFSSFYNVAVSADGSERAKTIFNPPSGYCGYDSTDTGGVFLERRTSSGWVADGAVTAPSLPGYAGDPAARWANCSDFGTVTQLSADGTTLLVAPDMARVWDPDPSGGRYRCAAYVYRRGNTGWSLDAVLYPPGADARGSLTWEGCGYFGIGGAISDSGNRVAMLAAGLGPSGGSVLRADVYVESPGGWSAEQQVTLPSPNGGCAHTIGPRLLSLSGDGATMLVGSPDCDDAALTAAGLVYAYTRVGSVWTRAQTIHSPVPVESQRFGLDTALSEDGATAVIGSSGSSWVLERDAAGWRAGTQLSQPGLQCPTLAQDGARIICGALETVGFNAAQGAIYIYDRPAAGWSSAQPQALKAFAGDGLGSDLLGQGQPRGWLTLAAPEDGSFIDAPMSPTGLAFAVSPHDRIGYEFATDAFDPSAAVDPTLTLAAAGTGSGAVASDPSGIVCGSTCWRGFGPGTSVTLAATPRADSVFVGWSGACTGTGRCTVTMSQSASVTATFTLVSATLTISRAGDGYGSVSSEPTGVSCGTICSSSFPYGATVTLSPTPALGARFSGWAGACTGTGGCTVTMTQAQSVTATFTRIPEPFTVSRAGNGSGTVSSNPAGISCGSTCSTTFNYGATVILTASPATGSVFVGWTGACTGTGTCAVTMNQAQSVSATLNLMPELLTVRAGGNGSGSVTSKPDAISCGSACSSSFAYGTKVTLTATPGTGSRFAGWTGACTGTSTCTVTMSQARSATATFTLILETLAVHRFGTGRVASTTPGISCGSTCSHGFSYGTQVTLTAAPATGSRFSGWSGACVGTGSTCTVTMTQAQSVTATFVPAAAPRRPDGSGGPATVVSLGYSPQPYLSCDSSSRQNIGCGRPVTPTASIIAATSPSTWPKNERKLSASGHSSTTMIWPSDA
ncbi:MAG: trimeric autotransporter adhesin [Gaiellaceae bacterium]|nr:trimeric autotransporter adhesin [Gaiellaceae bacterium]